MEVVTDAGAVGELDSKPRLRRPRLRGALLFLLVAVAISLALALTFEFVWSADGSRVTGRYDIFRYYAPLTYFVDTRIEAGEFPFWNPLTYCGVPNTGNPQSFIFYPPNLVRSLSIPDHSPHATQVSMVVMWALHMLMMGMGMFYLGRAHGLSVAASLTSAVVLLCSALVVRRATEFHFLLTTAWLPIILLVVKRGVDADVVSRKLRCALLGGLLLGMSILGGFLQVVNLIGVTIGGYAILYSLLRIQPHGGTWRATIWRGVLDGLLVLVVILVGSMIAAATLLPARELTAYTVRQAGMETPLFSDLRTWDVMRFIQSLTMFAGPKWEPETIRLCGIIATVLAAAALTHRRRKDVALFGILLVVFVELSFGPPFPLSTLVERLTPFSQSAYTRAWDFLLFPFAMLAGFGLDAVLRARRGAGAGLTRGFFLAYVGVFCLVCLAVWLKPGYYVPVTWEVIAIPAMGVGAIVVVSMLRLLGPARQVAGTVVLMMLFLEMLAWNQRYVPLLVASQFKEAVPIRTDVREIPVANTRDADPIANRFLYSLRFSMNGVDPLHFGAVRDILSGPPRDAHPYRLIHNWETTRENTRGNLLFKRSFWLARQAVEGPMPGKQELFPPTMTVFIDDASQVNVPVVSRDSVSADAVSERTVTKAVEGPAGLFETVRGETRLPTVSLELPRSEFGVTAGSTGALHSVLTLTYQSSSTGTIDFWIEEPGSDRSTHGKRIAMAIANAEGTTARIALPDYPRQNVQISIQPNDRSAAFRLIRASVESDLNDEDGLITVDSRGANYAELTVGPLPGPRVLSFLDADYPGWHVSVDGAPATMVRTFGPFKGVALEQGTHNVRFEFRPRLTYIAIGISAVSAALTILAVLILSVMIMRAGGMAISAREG